MIRPKLLIFHGPDLANEIENIKDLKAIVSTCPFCKRNIKDGCDALGRDYEVIDLTELLLKSL